MNVVLKIIAVIGMQNARIRLVGYSGNGFICKGITLIGCTSYKCTQNKLKCAVSSALHPCTISFNWGKHERAPHRRPKHVKICIYVCLSVSLTQILLTPIATLYDNGFSGRVQNSSRAFNYPCHAPEEV